MRHQVEFSADLLDQAFGFTHRQLLGRDLVAGGDLRGAVQRQQCAGMAHVDIARHQHGLHGFGQVEQTQQIAGRAARAAHGLRGLLVREAKLANQALQALCFFQRVEVFALDVFDQRHGRSGLVGHLAHQHGHFRQPSQARGAEAPLARDDFVLARVLSIHQTAHQNRLHDALGLDGFGQLIQRAFVHARARLVHAGHQLGQWQRAGQARLHGLGLLDFFFDLGAEQCFEATAEALGFFGNHVYKFLKSMRTIAQAAASC